MTYGLPPWSATSASTSYTARRFSGVRTSQGVPAVKTFPSLRSTILSEYFAAMFSSWLTITTERPLLRDSSLRRPATSIWCLTSRLAVGSSSRRTSGSWTRPLAIITFWRCPAESSVNGRNARSSISSLSSMECAAFRSSLAEPILL